MSDWTCKARASSLPDPQDCDWPHCGCDPHAPKVLEALQEEGYLSPREADALRVQVRAEALEEAAQMAEIDARAISKGTHGRMGSTTAVGEHIAQAIRAIASIEAAEHRNKTAPRRTCDDLEIL